MSSIIKIETKSFANENNFKMLIQYNCDSVPVSTLSFTFYLELYFHIFKVKVPPYIVYSNML